MAQHNQFGKWGENIACETMISKGYAIEVRNWRVGHYEVDIVARKGNRIIFVEVKARHNADTHPMDVFDRGKQQRILRSANAYVKIYKIPLDIQFDFILITGDPHSYTVEHIEDVYIRALRTYR